MKALLIALLLAAVYVATAQAQLAPLPQISLSPEITVTPGAAQGKRGDLVHMPAGTIQGVHVIQGGSLECDNPDLEASSGCDPRRKSFALDIGAGSAADRGHLALNYDVGDETRIFNGRKRIRVRATRGGVRLYGKVEVCDGRTCIDLARAIRGLRARSGGAGTSGRR